MRRDGLTPSPFVAAVKLVAVVATGIVTSWSLNLWVAAKGAGHGALDEARSVLPGVRTLQAVLRRQARTQVALDGQFWVSEEQASYVGLDS